MLGTKHVDLIPRGVLSSLVLTVLLLAVGGSLAPAAAQRYDAVEFRPGREPGEGPFVTEMNNRMARRVATQPFRPWMERRLRVTGQILAQAQHSPPPEQEEGNASSEQPLTLTEQVIRDVLEPLQRGIQEHALAQVLAIFDQQQTPDYAQLRDQLRAFFQQYEAVRFRYKVLQVTSEKDRGFAIAEIDIAATPADETQLAVQRTTQMRFQMTLGTKGWKLVGFKPSDFFAQ
ncbi:MAG TPA: hypothetical protein VF742_07595 [Terracidiphilus sp.]